MTDSQSRAHRTHDVVLFGATGFVGKLTAIYLADRAPEGTRIALAGRDEQKLEQTRSEIAAQYPRAAEFPFVVADSTDSASLQAMAESTRVVITTVGPYLRFGEKLTAACATAGTHYVDLCGETLFMRQTIDNHNVTAQATGARIVQSCGFDSVPSDIGMLLLHEEAKKHSPSQLDDATLIVKMKGGLSGGTVDSIRNQFAEVDKNPKLGKLLADPYTTSPDRDAEPDLGAQPDHGFVSLDEYGEKGGFAGPFVMASCNTRVVRRSNALQGFAYGPRLRYREFMYTGKGLKGRATSYAIGAALGVGIKLIQNEKLRPKLARWIPEPGEGPDEASRENGFFRTTHYGTLSDGTRIRSSMEMQADPGYKGTSLLLGEAALTLALHEDELPKVGDSETGGGVRTPATGLGMPYVRRLREAGVKLGTA